MSLSSRIERLERQFFPTEKDSVYWPEFLFVFYLRMEYGDKVEQHISGIRLYEFQRLEQKILRGLRKDADSRKTPASPPATTSDQARRPLLLPAQLPAMAAYIWPEFRDDSMNSHLASRNPDFAQTAKVRRTLEQNGVSTTARSKQ